MSIDAWTPNNYTGTVELLMKFHPNNNGQSQIPDPYHEGIEAFYPIIDNIEAATQGLLDHIAKVHNL